MIARSLVVIARSLVVIARSLVVIARSLLVKIPTLGIFVSALENRVYIFVMVWSAVLVVSERC